MWSWFFSVWCWAASPLDPSDSDPWRVVGPLTDEALVAVSIDPRDPSAWQVVTASGVRFVTDDAGATWSRRSDGAAGWALEDRWRDLASEIDPEADDADDRLREQVERLRTSTPDPASVSWATAATSGDVALVVTPRGLLQRAPAGPVAASCTVQPARPRRLRTGRGLPRVSLAVTRQHATSGSSDAAVATATLRSGWSMGLTASWPVGRTARSVGVDATAATLLGGSELDPERRLAASQLRYTAALQGRVDRLAGARERLLAALPTARSPLEIATARLQLAEIDALLAVLAPPCIPARLP